MIKKRKTFLDVLRVMAAIGVALYHVLTSSTNLDPILPQQTRDFVTALANVLLWHVPVFLLITGFLWLSDERECTYAKVLPGVRRYVLALFTVGFFYGLLERIFVAGTMSLEVFLGALKDVVTGDLWVSMWYVYAVIGVYLTLPLLKPYFLHSSLKDIFVLTGLFFVFGVITPNVLETTGYRFPISFPVMEPAYTIFFVCAGGLLSRFTFSRRSAAIGAVLFCLSSCVAFVFAWLFPTLTVWVRVFSTVSAIGLFVAVKVWVKDAPEIPWLRCVADCSFGIYLFHQLAVNAMLKVCHVYPLRGIPLLWVPCALLAVVTVSFVITYLLRKIRWVRKYIL